MLLTTVLLASVNMRRVGRGFKQEKLLGERKFPDQDCRGQVPGMRCLFGGHTEVLVIQRGVSGSLHQARPGSRVAELTVWLLCAGPWE